MSSGVAVTPAAMLERPLRSLVAPAGGVVLDPWLRTAVVVPATRSCPDGVGDAGRVAGTMLGHLGRGAGRGGARRTDAARSGIALPHGATWVTSLGAGRRPAPGARPVSRDEARAVEDRSSDLGDPTGEGYAR